MQITKTLVEHIYRYDGRYTNAENKKKAVYLLFHNWLYYRNFTCSRGEQARPCGNCVAPGVVLAGKGKGGQAHPLQKHSQQVVPSLRQHRILRNPVQGRAPRPGRPLICFFFLINFGYEQNLSKKPSGGGKCRIYANRAVSGGFNYRYFGGSSVASVQ